MGIPSPPPGGGGAIALDELKEVYPLRGLSRPELRLLPARGLKTGKHDEGGGRQLLAKDRPQVVLTPAQGC
jgi:hypothetical protein